MRTNPAIAFVVIPFLVIGCGEGGGQGSEGRAAAVSKAEDEAQLKRAQAEKAEAKAAAQRQAPSMEEAQEKQHQENLRQAEITQNSPVGDPSATPERRSLEILGRLNVDENYAAKCLVYLPTVLGGIFNGYARGGLNVENANNMWFYYGITTLALEWYVKEKASFDVNAYNRYREVYRVDVRGGYNDNLAQPTAECARTFEPLTRALYLEKLIDGDKFKKVFNPQTP